MDAIEMPVNLRVDELLQARVPPISLSELARKSGISFPTINAIAKRRTKQVTLQTIDQLCAALTELLGEPIAPGDLFERVPEPKPKRGGKS
jgi:DNA-binding Xre family transcriptional regulator